MTARDDFPTLRERTTTLLINLAMVYTALVSKTILSQCNTFLTHSLIDQTSLNFLDSVYSSEHTRLIPNLRQFEFLAFGNALRAERPVLLRRPFDPDKKAASEALPRPLQEQPARPVAPAEIAERGQQPGIKRQYLNVGWRTFKSLAIDRGERAAQSSQNLLKRAADISVYLTVF